MKCFSGLIVARDMLRDYSIDITDSDDYDYEFIHSNVFVDTNLPLNQSIDMGIENLSNKSGDFFLFHGGDSTSIIGAYEVFVESNAIEMKLVIPDSNITEVPKLILVPDTVPTAAFPTSEPD